ncbi:polysaccharide biosynthesis tyrosine autokinase [Curtobacterium pusillum]|uniref:BY-kinase domain-containing protein n=1 Tax=Curtobacterium pusillum TaxID=69373 RepID=UPI0011A8618E|nr:polysaccharide biosynthesis tyrosine autokinase [Curtobacterium pusillum]
MTETGPVTTHVLDLRDFIRTLRSFWAGAVTVLGLTVTIAACWTMTQDRLFTSTASAIVQVAGADDVGLALSAENLAKSKAESYAEMSHSIAVANRAAAALGADADADAERLIKRIASSVPADTSIVEIEAVAGNPEDAQRLARAWTDALAANVDQMNTDAGQDTEGAGTVRLVPLAVATLPTSPTEPRVGTVILVATLLGSVGAVLYALVRNQLDRRIRSAEILEAELGLPVVGRLPFVEHLENRRALATDAVPGDGADTRTAAALTEALREIRTNLSFLNVDDPPRSLVISSSTAGEGKTTVAANLAATIAQSGQQVVLIDCDLRRPAQANLLGLTNGTGLSDVLSGRAKLHEVVQHRSDVENLHVITSGRTPPNPSELLASRAMRDLVATLEQDAFLVLDAPPLLAVTDAAILSREADGMLLVVSAKRTTLDQVRRAVDAVHRVSGRIFGAVLNRVPVRGIDAHYFGYYADAHYYVSPASEMTKAEQPAAGPASRPSVGGVADQCSMSVPGPAHHAPTRGPR